MALSVAVVGVFAYSLSRPVSNDTTKVSFVVPKGQAIGVIANRLAEAKLIRHPLAFRIIVKVKHLENKLQAGSFKLSPSMSTLEIAQQMTQGTNDVWLTIPEGLRREEIAETIDKLGLPEFDKQEFLALTAGEEGKLYPDTYLIAKESTAKTIHSLLFNTFNKKMDSLASDAYDHTLDQTLIMASIVQRESRGYEDMRHVAGILWNRIKLGMPVQADATLQYAKGANSKGEWWSEPLGADRQLKSPFNTYTHPGLPPHPISNPGLDAIKATLNPLETNDLFYLHDPQGGIHYAQTLEEHNANINRYLR